MFISFLLIFAIVNFALVFANFLVALKQHREDQHGAALYSCFVCAMNTVSGFMMIGKAYSLIHP